MLTRPRASSGALALIALLGTATAVSGQAVPQAQPAAPAADSAVAPRGATPGGAFLRSVLVPGWGHASIGSSTRAGFYFVLEATSAYGVIRTRKRIAEARMRADFRESVLREDLATQGVIDPVEVEQALDEDPELEDLRNLTEARLQQQEDWLAFGIFLLFLSGADAYVSAHLKDFPTPIDIGATPTGNGGMEIAVSIPLGGR